MAIVNRIAEFHADMTAWRHEIHAHPETAFEEFRTADFVAKRLGDFGIEVHRGLAGTGVVGTLKGGNGSQRSIARRADMDALHIHEKNGFDHVSQNPGKMHACGHDGHTTMLLGAARYLAETRNFDGTVHFIFQPAEENEGGARVMVEQGLFDQFPVEAVYGMHNMPGYPVGSMCVRNGPLMAAYDVFEIVVRGRGSHGAMPHQGIDPVVTAAQIVTSLQTIASRNTNPLDSVVVSVTQVHGGDTWNVIPDEIVLRGTTRSFRPEVQKTIEPSIRRIAEGIAQAHGAKITGFRYEMRYPPTVNTAAETEIAARAASAVIGEANLVRDPVPSMGAEDFAFMLQARPGSYVWIGNGPTEGGCLLHNPHYDFSDEILPIGASYWATLVEQTLPRRA
ncbi:MAG: amidohydrolase [Alphaproteobacteria bacterium]|nr:amidohydrolase [Alphaproteobacteria bacterium]